MPQGAICGRLDRKHSHPKDEAAYIFHDTFDTRKFDDPSAVSSTFNNCQLECFGLTLRYTSPELHKRQDVPPSLPEVRLDLRYHSICEGFQQSGYHEML